MKMFRLHCSSGNTRPLEAGRVQSLEGGLLGLVRGGLILLLVGGLLAACAEKSAVKSDDGPDQAQSSHEKTSVNKLLIEDEVVGIGEEATRGRLVSVHYTGRLEDGTTFDSSLDRGTPFEFQLGVGQVIPGWDQGVEGMRVGGKRRLTIPPRLGYGKDGVDPIIPPNAVLIFDIELLDVS